VAGISPVDQPACYGRLHVAGGALFVALLRQASVDGVVVGVRRGTGTKLLSWWSIGPIVLWVNCWCAVPAPILPYAPDRAQTDVRHR